MTYDAICDKCGHEGEIEKPMADEFPRKCPKCKCLKLRQDYAKKHIIVQDLTPKTWGQQSELNRKQRPHLAPEPEKKPKKKTPWWRKEGSKPLNLKTIKDPVKYIETGDKS